MRRVFDRDRFTAYCIDKGHHPTDIRLWLDTWGEQAHGKTAAESGREYRPEWCETQAEREKRL